MPAGSMWLGPLSQGLDPGREAAAQGPDGVMWTGCRLKGGCRRSESAGSRSMSRGPSWAVGPCERLPEDPGGAGKIMGVVTG